MKKVRQNSQTRLLQNHNASGRLFHRGTAGSPQGQIERMVRFFVALIFAAFAAAESQAQVASSTPASSATSSTAPQTSPATGTATTAGRFEQLRKLFEQLSPEQQERTLQNFHRWQDLSQDEREVLRQRERVQHQKESRRRFNQRSVSEVGRLQLGDEQRRAPFTNASATCRNGVVWKNSWHTIIKRNARLETPPLSKC